MVDSKPSVSCCAYRQIKTLKMAAWVINDIQAEAKGL